MIGFSKWQTFCRLWREGDARAIASALLRKVLARGNRFLDFNRRCIVCYRPNSSSTSSADVQKLTQHECLLGLNGQSTLTITQALQRKEDCWAAFRDGEIVAYVWIGRRGADMASDTGFIIPHDTTGASFWWRDLFVKPAWRRRGLTQRLLQTWLASVDQASSPALWAEIDAWNVASLNVHQHLGFDLVGNLLAFCFLGCRVYRYSSASTRVWTWRFSLRSFYH